MSAPYMEETGLHVRETDSGGTQSHEVRISGPFETPVIVSTSDAGDHYGLLVTFRDEQERRKKTIVSAADLVRSARDVCAMLARLGLFIHRNYVEEFVGYLQKQMQAAPSADRADRPGWVTDEVYILPNGTIIGEQSSGRTIHFAGDTTDGSAKGTLEEWQKHVAIPCMGNSRLETAICAALAGPLLRSMSEQSGGFHFYGPSSIGKTTLLHAAGSVSGVGHATWRTTPNGLEPLMVNANDGIVLLDEIGQSDARSVVEMIYTAANGQSKQRMTKDLRAAQSARWRVVLLSSGEFTIDTHARNAGGRTPGGAAVRMLDVAADAGHGLGVFEDIHGAKSPGEFADTLKSAASQFHGIALPRFVECLTDLSPDERRDAILERRDAFLALCGLGKGAGAEVGRAAKRAALVAAAGELAISLRILPWPVGQANDAVLKCFQTWRDARGGDSVGHDELGAIAQVCEFIERHGDARFQPCERDSGDRRVVHDRAGYKRTTPQGVEYLFSPLVFQNEVCKGYDPKVVLKALDARNYIRRSRKSFQYKVRLPSEGNPDRTKPTNVYCILESIREAGV